CIFRRARLAGTARETVRPGRASDVGDFSLGSDLRPKLNYFGPMSRRSSPFAKIALAFAFAFLTATTAAAGPYRLPWAPGVVMELTQDCNDSFFADHVGSGKNAWDFANGLHFPVSVAR